MTAVGSLADQLVERFVTAVADGEFAPFEPIPPEPQLAQRWQVSRLTVREAVRTLVQLGMLEVKRGRGTFVTDPSSWNPLDARVLQARARIERGSDLTLRLLEARLVVESAVAEIAASRRRVAHLAALEKALADMKLAVDDPASFAVADLAFHDALFDAADNVFISALIDPIHTLLEEARLETSQWPGARRRAVRAHGRIFRAVEARDPDGARRAMTVHLQETVADVRRSSRA